MSVNKKLKEIICCPYCKSDLNFDDEKNIICTKCDKKYFVKEGILVLL